MSKITKLLKKIEALWDMDDMRKAEAIQSLMEKRAEDLQALRVHTQIIYPSELSAELDMLYGSMEPDEDTPPVMDPESLSNTVGNFNDRASIENKSGFLRKYICKPQRPFRPIPLVVDLSGVSPENIEMTLEQIVQDFKNNHLDKGKLDCNPKVSPCSVADLLSSGGFSANPSLLGEHEGKGLVVDLTDLSPKEAADAIGKIILDFKNDILPTDANGNAADLSLPSPIVIDLNDVDGNDPINHIQTIIKNWQEYYQRSSEKPLFSEHTHQGEVDQEITTGVTDQHKTNLAITYIDSLVKTMLGKVPADYFTKEVSFEQLNEHIKNMIITELKLSESTQPVNTPESRSVSSSIMTQEEWDKEKQTNGKFYKEKIAKIKKSDPHLGRLMEKLVGDLNVNWCDISMPPMTNYSPSMIPGNQGDQPANDPKPEFNMSTRSPYGDFKVLTSNGWVSISELNSMDSDTQVLIIGFDPRINE